MIVGQQATRELINIPRVGEKKREPVVMDMDMDGHKFLCDAAESTKLCNQWTPWVKQMESVSAGTVVCGSSKVGSTFQFRKLLNRNKNNRNIVIIGAFCLSSSLSCDRERTYVCVYTVYVSVELMMVTM